MTKKTNTYLKMAAVQAELSHDDETQVGAILIKSDSGAVIATGYNGFVRGAIDDELPRVRPEKHEFMQHAERNLINNCAREGISTKDCVLFCTLSPCPACARSCFQAGITTIVYKEKHSSFSDTIEMRDIYVTNYEQDGFSSLRLYQAFTRPKEIK